MSAACRPADNLTSASDTPKFDEFVDQLSLELLFPFQVKELYSIYGTETWAMKADDLRSLERTERMMVRWMCGVSLKDRKRSEDLCNLLGINCVA